MNPERRDRLIKLAKERNDMTAVAILEKDRDYRPEPPDRPVWNIWSGLRWRTGSLEAAWWPKAAAA